jgi:hypothetical protein
LQKTIHICESTSIPNFQKTKNLYCGGADRDRTCDLLNANQALSQLSYSPKKNLWLWIKWACVDSNHGPHPYQGCALTT